MIKVFIPTDKGKIKSNIRGFWYSQDIKRTYYDYLKVKNLCSYSYGNQFNNSYTLNHLLALKIIHKQEAIFFVSQNKGYCFNDYYNVTELSNKKIFEHKGFKGLKWAIKECLSEYNGVTIYKKGNTYLLEVFYND